MAYSFEPGCEIVDEMRRIARDQVGTAVSDLEDPGDDVVEAVHDCRKRCKKLRGLVRLVRPALGDRYTAANTTFRDAARHLGPLRDAHALHATFEQLCEARRAQLPDDELAPVRDRLRQRAGQARDEATPDDPRIAAARDLLEAGEAMIDDWELDTDGFDAVGGGLHRTYRRGRSALEEALAAPTTEAFHEYRKRTKYTWYHVRLLAALAPSTLEPFGRRLHDLSDALGDEHDLAVLSSMLLAEPDHFGGGQQVAAAMLVVDGERADLQRRAIGLGARLHAERPKDFVRRVGAYWEAWQQHGDEPEAGSIRRVAPPA